MRSPWIALAVLSVFGILGGRDVARAESAILVEISELNGEKSYEVMSSPEYRELASKLRDEGFKLRTALRNVEKEWRDDENRKGQSFPSSVVKQRRARSYRRFMKREDAEAALVKMEEKLDKLREAREKKAKEKFDSKIKRYPRDEQKERRLELQAKEDAEAALEEEVIGLVRAELDKLLSEGEEDKE